MVFRMNIKTFIAYALFQKRFLKKLESLLYQEIKAIFPFVTVCTFGNSNYERYF